MTVDGYFFQFSEFQFTVHFMHYKHDFQLHLSLLHVSPLRVTMVNLLRAAGNFTTKHTCIIKTLIMIIQILCIRVIKILPVNRVFSTNVCIYTLEKTSVPTTYKLSMVLIDGIRYVTKKTTSDFGSYNERFYSIGLNK